MSEITAFFLDRLENVGTPLLMRLLTSFASDFATNKRERLLEAHPTDHDKIVLKGSASIPLRIGDTWFLIDSDVNISTATDLDTGSVSNGKDYYVYACDDNGVLKLLISLNSTYPQGFTAATSRKLGGFHTFCVDVGTISGHPLSGYTANEILPASIWDLKHRPVCEPQGMVYDEAIHKWVDIYFPSGTGANTASVYNATITKDRTWNDAVDDGLAIQKRLAWDHEFQHFAFGSNEETIIYEEEYPSKTGGHKDTDERRMISDIGVEDCCGAMGQWLLDQSYNLDGCDHTHPGDPCCGNKDCSPSWSWKDLPAGRGGFYHQGPMGDVKLIAGGPEDYEFAGSQGRKATEERWWHSFGTTTRYVAEPL